VAAFLRIEWRVAAGSLTTAFAKELICVGASAEA
jgi:hypothetical protein